MPGPAEFEPSAVAIVTQDLVRRRGPGIELLGRHAGAPARGCSLAVGPMGVLARGPYGEAVEAVTVVEVEPRPPVGRGTTVADALRARGYTGP